MAPTAGWLSHEANQFWSLGDFRVLHGMCLSFSFILGFMFPLLVRFFFSARNQTPIEHKVESFIKRSVVTMLSCLLTFLQPVRIKYIEFEISVYGPGLIYWEIETCKHVANECQSRKTNYARQLGLWWELSRLDAFVFTNIFIIAQSKRKVLLTRKA